MNSENYTARKASLSRKSSETEISLQLNLDGTGQHVISSGVGFLNHLFQLIAFWGKLDLKMECSGDLEVDAHHTVEDCGLLFGKALLEAMGNKLGIRRIGYGRAPMDEALAEVTIDLSGRTWLVWLDNDILPPIIAKEEKDVWREFFKAISSGAACNLHVDFRYGKNGHHLLESAAKGFGLALRYACTIDDNRITSTKGILDL